MTLILAQSFSKSTPAMFGQKDGHEAFSSLQGDLHNGPCRRFESRSQQPSNGSD